MALYIIHDKNTFAEVARYVGYGDMPAEQVMVLNGHVESTVACIRIEMQADYVADDYSLDSNGALVINPNANTNAIARRADAMLSTPEIESIIEALWEALPAGTRPVNAAAVINSAKQKLIAKLGG